MKEENGNKLKQQRNRKCKQLQYFSSTGSENVETEENKTDIHNKIAVEDSEKSWCGCWETYVQKTKEGDWIE